jgi:hypothetical protein
MMISNMNGLLKIYDINLCHENYHFDIKFLSNKNFIKTMLSLNRNTVFNNNIKIRW